MPSKPKFICKDYGLPGDSEGLCPRCEGRMIDTSVYNHPLRGLLDPLGHKNKRRYEVGDDR
jgi:hypothetical protein